MKITQHIRTRCQQRGIPEQDLYLVASYGTETNGGVILTRKDIAEFERETKRLMSRLERLNNVFIPTDGEIMKTTFRANRSQRRRHIGIW